jgi:[mycofactocin precursor peptide]-tyrosine decarboxylase / 3-amino-5-[(4-hydroxyphenyl)methyl]-4,4-dimethylpyrrolidin-2-one synthase
LKNEFAYKELLTAPVNVTWEIAARCNMQCRHCLSADLMEDCGNELDFNQCCRVIDDLEQIGVFQINFGGGEPFLREDFVDILHYARSKQITTCVSTNGTLLNETIVRRLKGLDLLYIQVSLDGATAATNDSIRGTGTFEKILAAIELLAGSGFTGVSTNTVVTGVNFKEISGIHEIGRRYGVKTRLSRFRPSGAARRVWKEYHLDRKALAELSEFLGTHREVLTGDSFFSISPESRRDLGLNMCGAARMTCSITPDGRVYPCAFLQDDLFLAGRVTEESLGSIWHTAGAFKALRNIKVESCGDCIRFNQCHGGCPAVAYYFTKSLNRSDPECMAQFQPELTRRESDRGALTHAGTV